MRNLARIVPRAVRERIKKAVRAAGYEIVRPVATDFPPDFDEQDRSDTLTALKYTMTSVAQIASLREAVRYIVDAQVPGDVVECGVWRGGSMMAAALTLLRLGRTDRHLYLFDTFAGMPPPGPEDTSYKDYDARKTWEESRRPDGANDFCYASIDDVRRNLLTTGYPEKRIHLIQGKVEDTLPEQAPAEIALLRLDTDWYESTRHELHHLYPRLSRRGVLIVDDYGCWRGSRKATDEYLREQGLHLLLERQGAEGRITVKP